MENEENYKYLVDNKDITLEELHSKYYSIILDELDKNNYDMSLCTEILIWKDDREKQNIYYGFCEDCNQLNKLHYEEACADGNNCCMKLICIDKCVVYCSRGHVIFYENYGYQETLECSKCNKILNPHSKNIVLALILLRISFLISSL